MVCLVLSGCSAGLEYPRTRLTNEMLNATNSCLDHGGVYTFNVFVNEELPNKGPIVGVKCMDEKYFEVLRDSSKN